MSDEELALDGEEIRDLARVIRDVSIAPLGRNYFDRYREVRDAIGALAEETENGVAAEDLREHLDEDDYEFLDSIVRSLDNFAGEGYHRKGKVEPYISARADADRLEPFLDLLRPHLTE